MINCKEKEFFELVIDFVCVGFDIKYIIFIIFDIVL